MIQKKKNKKVMVFGVFDGLHKGHRYFLREAKKHGDYLLVVVARDSSVEAIKKKKTVENEEVRIKKIQDETLADEVVLGDEEQGSWQVFKNHRPDIVVLGYDQTKLEEELKRADKTVGISFVRIGAHEPNRFKSSFFRNQ